MITTSESGLRDTNPPEPTDFAPVNVRQWGLYRTLNSESCQRPKERRFGIRKRATGGSLPPPAYGASMRSSAYWTDGLNEWRSSKRRGTARMSLHHGDHGQEALFARLTKTSEGHGLDPEIRDFENDVFAIDRVRCNHVSTCSEEHLDRLLFRVRVARMRFGMAKVQLVRPVTWHQPTRSDLSTLISRRDQPVVGPAS